MLTTNSFYTQTAYLNQNDDYFNQLDYLVEDFQDALHEVFPSVYACNHWVDKERQAIANNRFAEFGITIKDNMIEIFVVPKTVPKLQLPLRNEWIKSIGDTFAKVTKATFILPQNKFQ